VDAAAGLVLHVHVTTGEENESGELVPALDRIEALTGTPVSIATADAGYAYAMVYGRPEERSTDTVIPPRAEPIRSRVPMRRSASLRRNTNPPWSNAPTPWLGTRLALAGRSGKVIVPP